MANFEERTDRYARLGKEEGSRRVCKQAHKAARSEDTEGISDQ